MGERIEEIRVVALHERIEIVQNQEKVRVIGVGPPADLFEKLRAAKPWQDPENLLIWEASSRTAQGVLCLQQLTYTRSTFSLFFCANDFSSRENTLARTILPEPLEPEMKTLWLAFLSGTGLNRSMTP